MQVLPSMSALEYLDKLIEEGYEYPNAEWKTHKKYKIPVRVLQYQYDNRKEKKNDFPDK